MKNIFLSAVLALFCCSAFAQVPAYVPTLDLEAWYSFTGNADDESGNANNSTYIGTGVTPTDDKNANSNSAYHFDGLTGSYISLPSDNMPFADRTISLWFKTPDVSNRPVLFGYGGGGVAGTSFFMGLNVSGLGGYHSQGHANVNQVNIPYGTEPLNQWTHYVFSIEGNIIRLYVDGALLVVTGVFTVQTTVAGTDLAIGVATSVSGVAPYTDPNVDYFQGDLDEIGVWHRALTQCEINQLYNESFNGSTTTVGTCSANYVWTDGNTYTGTGTYMQILTDVDGCDSTALLDISFNAVDPSFTNSAPWLSANTTGATYQWLDCDSSLAPISGANNQHFYAPDDGNYAVVVSQSGCVDTSACQSVTYMGLSKSTFEQSLIIYPNPTEGVVAIKLGKVYSKINVIVTNQLGQQILTKTFKNSDILNLSIEGQAGLYYVEVVSEQGERAQLRFLKK